MKKILFCLTLLFSSSVLSSVHVIPAEITTVEDIEYQKSSALTSSILEIRSYITELISIYSMGNPSPFILQLAALINIIGSSTNIAFDTIPIVRQWRKQKIYPKNTFELFQEAYYVPFPLLIDAYFLTWDIKKLRHAKNLALFYEKNEHIRHFLKEQRHLLLKKLFLSMAVRGLAFYTAYYVHKNSVTLSKTTATILSASTNISLFICDIVDVIRKYERPSNEFYYFFEWMERGNYEWTPCDSTTSDHTSTSL